MRKIRTALAVAVVTVAAGTLLTGPAQAAPDRVAGPNCASLYRSYQGDGYVRAYDAVDCYEQLGAAQGDDGNWNDASGPFRKPANDKATSLLNTGTYAGGVNNVMFYADASHEGVRGCLAWSELYVDDLRDNVLKLGSTSTNANNVISSHLWTSGCTNPLT
ncbi:hypothetical protein [Streptomyces sp. NPDC127119]|uniref:hypothetical protein n=1 Tax=Streptomyces sp. NPDC127119 TaxID=3345370 RepID=UPI00363146DA